MKIQIGDAGGDDQEPRWLLHGTSYTPKDPEWIWHQWWLGWGHVDELKFPGWQYGGLVFFRIFHWGPLWVTSARMTRGTPFRPSRTSPKSDQLR